MSKLPKSQTFRVGLGVKLLIFLLFFVVVFENIT